MQLKSYIDNNIINSHIVILKKITPSWFIPKLFLINSNYGHEKVSHALNAYKIFAMVMETSLKA